MGSWTFLSNHIHVLVCLARDPQIRLREVSEQVGITERAVQRIVGELVDVGAVTKEKQGRRNRYRIHKEIPLRHVLEEHVMIGAILDLVV